MDNNKKHKSKNHVKFSNRREAAFYANLGKKLSSALKEQRLTQEAFAENVDISVGMAREHLRGTRRMYLYKYLRITRTASVIQHKVSELNPRCKKQTYDVTYCEDCDYTKETLVNTTYINCCPED